jgi:hypothetical protein
MNVKSEPAGGRLRFFFWRHEKIAHESRQRKEIGHKSGDLASKEIVFDKE